MDQELADKLDTIIGLLNLAFAEPIQRARDAVMRDPVKAAVIDAIGSGPMDAGALQSAVRTATGQSDRTVSRRLAELLAQGMVMRSGTGPKGQYRLSGLMGGASPGGGRASLRG
jgi:DNA-binding transcriptional ArsR family regulator